MYRRIALTIALAVSVLSLALVSSDSTEGSHHRGFAADTGVVTLGPNQILRITAVNGGKAESNIRFTKMEYSQGTCESGVCAHQVASDTTSAPVTLAPGGGLSMDFYSASEGRWVRGVVLSNSQEVRVTALIIETTTGNIVNVNNLGSALGAPGN